MELFKANNHVTQVSGAIYYIILLQGEIWYGLNDKCCLTFRNKNMFENRNKLLILINLI
jgi:hypothetical protein